MNRKQKKELRERQSTRQLMGISQLTDHGVKTAKGELVFFMLRPDNLSVLSPEGVRGRVTALTNLLRATPAVRFLAMDSRESFQANQDFYRRRLEEEPLPAVRELLRQDAAHLDDIQATTASAREFALVYPVDKDSAADPRQTEKSLRDGGFHVRLADTQDIKRILSVAALCAIEYVNPKMPETVEAAALKEMNQRGEIPGCIVEGPISYDVAMYARSARQKGFDSPVAGDPDLLLWPNITVGNIASKILDNSAGGKGGGLVVGTRAPVILTSRGDTPEGKYRCIALGAAFYGANHAEA